jgi:tetratricopeptide (TPR) repeat protein
MAEAAQEAIADRLDATIRDRYVIERELGRGGMATVFLAHDLRHDRPVALKVLHTELASNLGPERFKREILLAARLQHPHIVPVFDSGGGGNVLWYTMPYVAGHSLSARLAGGELLSIPEAVRILRNIAGALAHAHGHGVVHRDVKPGNVLLSDGHALVMDFGVAKVIRDAVDSELTQPGIAVGTPAYMAPEQASAEPNIDHRADIYAFGALGYALLTGEPPFRGTANEMMVAHTIREPEPVSRRRPDTPPALAQLIMTCLQKDPANRWQSSRDICGQLDELMGFGGQLPTPSGGLQVSMPASELEAGRTAFARYEWAAAFQHLTAAGELEPGDLARLAEAAWWLGRGNECVRNRERAYAAYVRQGDQRGAAAIALALAEDYWHWLALSIARGWLRRAERHLAGLPESREHGWLVRLQMTLALEVDRNLARALELNQQAAAIAERVGDPDLRALSLQDRGRILLAEGEIGQGMTLIDDAMAAAAAGDLMPMTTGKVYCNMMTACDQIADYRRAAEWHDAAAQWVRPHSDSAFPGICRVHRAELLRVRGALADAEAEARRAAEQVGDLLPAVAGEAYYEMAEVRLRMGDFERADALFREAHQRGRHPLPGLALLRLAQGQAVAARHLIERALEDPTLARFQRARLLPASVEISLACNAVAAARAVAEELGEIANLYNSSAMRAAAALATGMVELAEGRAEAAAVSLRRAVRQWTEIDLPYEAASSRVLLAQASEALGHQEEANLELDAASVAFERLGARADLAKLVTKGRRFSSALPES